MDTSYGLIQLFADGGWMMYPLLLSSLLGLGVIIAKGYVLWVARRDTRRILDEVTELARERRLDDAIELAERTPGPVSAIVLSGLYRIREHRAGKEVEQAMTSAGKVELGFLERGLVLLATVATVAPLLGFLGTVWGMIAAFAAIEAAGQVEASLVASGIKIALITTAAGLVIAIPVNVAYNFFVTRIDQLILDMEEGTNAVVSLLWDVFALETSVAGGGKPHRADGSGTLDDTQGTRERTLGFDTQGTITPDKDTLKSPEHRTLD
ncbi:MAG TPA: MotA/TolQ/ExbB proton channel family protein [Longimicrobiaceae bacterium]|nr:MotA/TolQ/ExbB proton channel family protein [Longimicrobiaceae bacterium]